MLRHAVAAVVQRQGRLNSHGQSGLNLRLAINLSHRPCLAPPLHQQPCGRCCGCHCRTRADGDAGNRACGQAAAAAPAAGLALILPQQEHAVHSEGPLAL